jgi:hypothetical protein
MSKKKYSVILRILFSQLVVGMTLLFCLGGSALAERVRE